MGRRRGCMVAVLVVLLVLGAAAAAVLLLLPGWARERAMTQLRERAAALGWRVDGTPTSLSPELFVVEGVSAEPLDGTKVRVEATSLRVALRDWEPAAFVLAGAEVDAEATPAALAGLVDRARAAAGGDDLPGRVELDRLSWRSGTGELRLRDAKVRLEDGVELQATGFEVAPASLGPALVRSDGASATFEFGLGRASGPPPLRVVVHHSGDVQRLTLELRAIDAATLTTAWSGLSVPDALKGPKLDADLGLTRTASGASGLVRVVISGWTPPFPSELAGIAFGDRTELSASVELQLDESRLVFKALRMLVGRFSLEGTAVIAPLDFTATAVGRLDGSVPCTVLAEAAVASQVDGALGAIARKIVRGALKGAISIQVPFKVTLLDPTSLRFSPGIGVGCGLQPRKRTPEEEALLALLPAPLQDDVRGVADAAEEAAREAVESGLRGLPPGGFDWGAAAPSGSTVPPPPASAGAAPSAAP